MDKIERGESMEELIRSNGWGYLQEHLQTEIDKLTDSLIKGSFTDITERNLQQKEYFVYKELIELPNKWIKEKNKLTNKDNK